MVEYKVTKNDLFGDIEDFPIEVVKKMVQRCGEENEVNIITKLQISRLDGFIWKNSIEGYDFWNEVIYNKNFDLFFEKYPKSKHSDSQIETIEINGKKYKKNEVLNCISKLKEIK